MQKNVLNFNLERIALHAAIGFWSSWSEFLKLKSSKIKQALELNYIIIYYDIYLVSNVSI